MFDIFSIQKPMFSFVYFVYKRIYAMYMYVLYILCVCTIYMIVLTCFSLYIIYYILCVPRSGSLSYYFKYAITPCVSASLRIINLTNTQSNLIA